MLGFLTFILRFMLSEAASEERFDQIKIGMTKEQVVKLLGVPHHVHLTDLKRSTLAYGGFTQFKWCTMEIILIRTNEFPVNSTIIKRSIQLLADFSILNDKRPISHLRQILVMRNNNQCNIMFISEF
ncbi:MAG: SmpA / OmlA family [Verrucomicrobiota bacterium]